MVDLDITALLTVAEGDMSFVIGLKADRRALKDVYAILHN